MQDVSAYFDGFSAPSIATVELTTVGHQHSGAGADYPPAGHPPSHDFRWCEGRVLQEFHLVYVLRGAGHCELKGRTLDLNAGGLLMIKQGDWHRYRPLAETGWEAYWIGFRIGAIGPDLDAVLFPECVSKIEPIGLRPEIVELFETLLSLFVGVGRYMPLIAGGLILQMLGQIVERREAPSAKPVRPTTRAALYTIHRNAFRCIDVPGLAAHCNMSYSRFRTVFKDDTGVSPHQFILNERIDFAKRLLRDHTLDIASIAFKAGFESPSYFSRIFRRKVGVSPSEWRIRTMAAI